MPSSNRAERFVGESGEDQGEDARLDKYKYPTTPYSHQSISYSTGTVSVNSEVSIIGSQSRIGSPEGVKVQ